MIIQSNQRLKKYLKLNNNINILDFRHFNKTNILDFAI